jgi:hypothetical protein
MLGSIDVLLKNFANLVAPFTHLLQKDVPFIFYNECITAFEQLKATLVTIPIIQPPNWKEPFEIMCDASDYAIGVV